MNNKLLIRPNPFPDESFLGYIIRLCEINGYDSPSDVLKIAQEDLYTFSTDLPKIIHQNLESFANIILKDKQALSMMLTPSISNETCRFFNTPIRHKILRTAQSKFCPLCLRSEHYYRAMWDLIVVTVCPIHKCLLITNCPKCKSVYKIGRKYICRCKCGFDLREINNIEKVSDLEIRVAGYLYFQLGIQTTENHQLPFDNPLINFSFEDSLNILKYFAMLMTKENNVRFNRNLFLDNKVFHKALCKALSIFDNFPNNYLSFLNDRVFNSLSVTNNKSHSIFTRLHPGIYFALPQIYQTFFNKVFTENIDTIFYKNGLKKDRELINKEIINQFKNYIPVSKAEKYLKLTKSEFKYLLSSEQLKAEFLDYNQRKTWLIKTDAFLKLKLEKFSWISDLILADQLDISIKLVKQLAHDDYIPVRTKNSFETDVIYSFDGDLFIKLISKLRSKIKSQQASEKCESVNFKQIEFILNHNVKLISNFFGLCFKGKIKPIQELFAERGLKRFLFAARDVKKFIRHSENESKI